MPFFQNAVLNKHLKTLNSAVVQAAYQKFTNYFHNPVIQNNIRDAKEEQFQEGFLRELFVNVFGYAINPEPNFNLTTEFKNLTGAKKADGAILQDGKAIAVIELKGTDTKALDKINEQAFNYKNNQTNCIYVITSNFEKLRFFIHNSVDHLEFNLFTLTENEFKLLWLCLASDNLLKGVPAKVKEESLLEEENISKYLYKDYANFRTDLWQNMVLNNPEVDQLTLFKKTQKLLDRILFVFFAEDGGLLPPNSISRMIERWALLKDEDAYKPLYDIFKQFFGYINTGRKGKTANDDIFAFNGGLFLPDEILDTIRIDDQMLHTHTVKLSGYDFQSEVDVNILGHIFENSLSEIENVKAQIQGQEIDKSKSKRKKDGIFYTPKYITKYIVENTLGKLCEEKKAELNIIDEEYAKGRKNRKKEILFKLDEQLKAYREWLLNITICDPACGSGAFLNQALEQLIEEHQYIDELQATLLGSSFIFPDVENHILEKNIFGVDLNEESVEIAKLSLWLRTAQRGRKLTSLNNNIKCGNSLIDDPSVAGEKAFIWQKEFPEVFTNGGFDIVIGNPPYGATLDEKQVQFFRKKYTTVIGHSEVYYLFTEKAIKSLVKKNGYVGYIIPNAWLSNKYAEKLRELLINETKIEKLINFNRKIIFEDANVETAIFISKKIAPKDEDSTLVSQDLINLYGYNQLEWKLNDNYLISFASNKKIDEIIRKVNLSEYKLSDKLDISNGFKPYQVGYGVNLIGNPLMTDDVNNRIYHSSTNDGHLYKKEIKGKGINRYTLKWEESYVNWGKWLMSPKSIHYFEQPKILVRQVISDYLFAFLDKEKYFADQSLYVCTNYKNKVAESLEFYLCLLNSKLYGFYFRKFYSEEDDLFPKIKVNELKNLPIKELKKDIQEPFIEKADLMISLNKELQTLSNKFSTYFSGQYKIENLSNKLEKWYDLEFSVFISELNKAIKTAKGIALTKKDEFEWIDLFNENKQKALALKTEIAKTDKEIDQMVYKLYELTDEEIAIIENKN